MRLPEVWETIRRVTVPLLQKKCGSHCKACNVLKHVFVHLILMTTLEGAHYYCPMQFRDEGTEAQRHEGICSRLLRESGQSWGFNSGLLILKLRLSLDATLRNSKFFSRDESLSGNELIKKKKTETKGFWEQDHRNGSAAPIVQA